MATIRLFRKKWQAIVRRKGYPSQSKSFDLRKDAEKWARQQERLFDTHQWVDYSEAERTTLHELICRYEEEVTATKRGANIEKYRLDLFKHSSLAKYSVASVSRQMIAQWRDERLKKVSSGTVLRELQVLSHIFTVAMKEWGMHLNSNPVNLIRKPQAGKARDKVLDDTQRNALIYACSQCKNPWVKPVVIFALETAARRGEILGLLWKDVDLKRRLAKLQETKSGTPRAVPLSPACCEMLNVLPRSIDGKVFPITIEALKQAYERAVNRAGIEDFTFHDLRHDALTRLAKMGFSVLELRAISGHTTTTMLQRYVTIDAHHLVHKFIDLKAKINCDMLA